MQPRPTVDCEDLIEFANYLGFLTERGDVQKTVLDDFINFFKFNFDDLSLNDREQKKLRIRLNNQLHKSEKHIPMSSEKIQAICDLIISDAISIKNIFESQDIKNRFTNVLNQLKVVTPVSLVPNKLVAGNIKLNIKVNSFKEFFQSIKHELQEAEFLYSLLEDKINSISNINENLEFKADCKNMIYQLIKRMAAIYSMIPPVRESEYWDFFKIDFKKGYNDYQNLISKIEEYYNFLHPERNAGEKMYYLDLLNLMIDISKLNSNMNLSELERIFTYCLLSTNELNGLHLYSKSIDMLDDFYVDTFLIFKAKIDSDKSYPDEKRFKFNQLTFNFNYEYISIICMQVNNHLKNNNYESARQSNQSALMWLHAQLIPSCNQLPSNDKLQKKVESLKERILHFKSELDIQDKKLTNDILEQSTLSTQSSSLFTKSNKTLDTSQDDPISNKKPRTK